MKRVFDMSPGSPITRQIFFGIGAFCLADAVILAWALPTARVASLVAFAAAGLVSYTAWSTRNVRFVLSPESLQIRGDLFGRTITRAALEVLGARLLSLDVDADLQPTLRTCGTSVPGYLAGWFRLKNREKALVFVTDRSRVVYVPTTLGYALLLSVAQPDEFLKAL